MAKEIAQRIRNAQLQIDKLGIYEHESPNKLTDQYGLMKFDENEIDSTTRFSEYIRLSLNTSAEKVVKFMKDGWRLSTPDLIISVTGGAKNCDMSARLRKIFQRGLVAAAITTNAWLITAGTNAGVVKEVGEALSHYRYKNHKRGIDVPCIGIGSWGYTAGNEQLEKKPPPQSAIVPNSKSIRPFARNMHSQAIHAIRIDLGDQYCVRNYIVKDKQKKRCDLEPNHTHFLLFDDGDSNADSVLTKRAEIEKCSRHVNTDTQTEGCVETLIPIVMVLVEGGKHSIRTICQALESNTPVVVVKESGRAADLVADLHALYSDNDSGYPSRPQTSQPRNVSRENDILTKFRTDNAWIDAVQNNLCQVLNERKQLVTIFKFDDNRHHRNLEDTILEALLNAAKFSGEHNEQHRRIAELKLAMAWQKFSYAQTHLLTDTTISKWKEDDLRRALVDALRRGHVDFVELLIEFGTPLEKLTVADLKQLYSTTLAGNRLPIKNKGKNRGQTKDDFYFDYFRSISRFHNRTTELNDNELLGNNALRDLFFWAIFLDRFELAKYLCSKTWNPSTAPLFGAQIYRRAARLTLDLDTKQKYEENADQFDAHAMAIIDRCFDNDENFAVDLITRPAAAFENIESLELAKKYNCKSFLASKSVQKHLDNEWFGYINYKRNGINFRIFLCSLFIPLIPIFCFFLPYVQKHKKIPRNARDSTRISQLTMIHNIDDFHERKEKHPVPWTDRIRYFYQAPVVRFYYYMIFFIVFLLLFSFVLLVDYFPFNTDHGKRSGVLNLQIPITEIILHICLWSLIIEEIRQFVTIDSKRDYISDIWNIMDVCAITLYLIGFITRFFVDEALFTVSKIFLCLDLILWYVRTLNLFAAYEKLGPKLIMILNTMKDLLFFLCFIVIFLIGFSVASWSLITTTDQIYWNYNADGSLYNVTIEGGGSGLWSWDLLRNVTNYGVWKIFGQVDPIDGSDAYSAVAFVLAMLFVAIANVLLLNVLVALFNVTIQHVAKQSHKIWLYQRCLIIFEYTEKPPLPPPVNTIYYVYLGLDYIYKQICIFCRKHRHAVSDNEIMNFVQSNGNEIREEFKITDAMQRESAIADDYWRETLKQSKQYQIDVALQNIEQRLHELKERIQTNNTSQILNLDQV